MFHHWHITCFSLFACIGSLSAKPASVASIDPADLVEYETQPQEMRQLIDTALALTKRNLTYTFGSNSPKNSGMDCSGTIQHVLQSVGVDKAPRTSYDFYHWVKKENSLTDARSAKATNDAVFRKLKPGDLVFWEGTYNTGKRNPPISHVMIYLGTLKEDGRGVVFGASDGRRFRGKKITGVSVFDWKIPSASSPSKFVAFGSVPGLEQKKPRIAAKPISEKKDYLKSLKSGLDKFFR